MSALDKIKEQVKFLYENNPEIHIDVNLSRPRLQLKNDKVKIVGIYPHIFMIEEYRGEEPKQHTLQYTDILIGQIVILELENKN